MSAPRTPTTPSRSRAKTKADWALLCEITTERILRKGFRIDCLPPIHSVRFGAELGTGVVLVLSAGDRTVYEVSHTDPGVTEGLRDMMQEGLEGKMILYGLTFKFVVPDP
ncbi:hypothetical protein F4802DRAFT_597084 [Xylaria palmicola]|nr:hypothetical protein F4802DRAFT_597084 [Xylaria palmicola]